MKRPRLNVLRTFEAAGRRLNFSTAAKDLNISQAAVSQQIRQLEKYLNTELFVRHHRQLFLTGTGSAYLEAVHEALDRLDTVTDQLFPGRQSQSVTLHCTASVAALWLAPQLGAFRKLHPNIDLRIRTLGRACVGDGPDSADPQWIQDEASGGLTVQSAKLDFGNVEIGTGAWRRVIVSNQGAQSIDIFTIKLTGSGRSQFALRRRGDTCSSTVLAPRTSCDFRVRFEPTAMGRRRAKVVITSNDPNGSKIRVKLRGTGVES